MLVEVRRRRGVTRVGYNRVEVQKRRPDGSTYSGVPQRPHRARVPERRSDERDCTTVDTSAQPRLKTTYREEIVAALQDSSRSPTSCRCPA